MKHVLASAVSIGGLLGLLGCAPATGPAAVKSKIVEKLEKAGAGDVSAVSKESLRAWLVKNDQLAHEVDEMCKPIRETAEAAWGDTVEGRVCTVAHEIAMVRAPSDVKSDGRTFRAVPK